MCGAVTLAVLLRLKQYDEELRAKETGEDDDRAHHHGEGDGCVLE